MFDISICKYGHSSTIPYVATFSVFDVFFFVPVNDLLLNIGNWLGIFLHQSKHCVCQFHINLCPNNLLNHFAHEDRLFHAKTYLESSKDSVECQASTFNGDWQMVNVQFASQIQDLSSSNLHLTLFLDTDGFSINVGAIFWQEKIPKSVSG